jgi:hypothetical protein
MATQGSHVRKIGVGGLLAISFHRTLRVPDSYDERIQKVYIAHHDKAHTYTLIRVTNGDKERVEGLKGGDVYDLYAQRELLCNLKLKVPKILMIST